jgi:Flp pilus assembly pilin Flp
MFKHGGFLPSALAVRLRSCGTMLTSSLRRLSRLVRSDEGQAMVEYAVLLVLMGVVVMVVLMVLGNQVRNVFCNISGGLGLVPRGPG